MVCSRTHFARFYFLLHSSFFSVGSTDIANARRCTGRTANLKYAVCTSNLGTLSPQPHPNRNVVTVTAPKPERCHRNITQTGTLSPEPHPNWELVTGKVGHTKDLVPFTDFVGCEEVVNLPVTRYPFGHPCEGVAALFVDAHRDPECR